MENPLAARTLDRATAAMRRDAVVCLPEIVRLMRTLSHKTSEVSVPELADVIQKDAVILSKVIGAANTLGYNPAAVPVTTVTQAIHVIGYERIRSLAMSLLLVEQSNRGRSAEEQSEVAALALTAGCIAQSAAESRLLLNPEEAFVCASLRNFGRIVMVTCMLDDYREAQQLAHEQPGDDAFRQIFGLTPLELGQRLLEASDLPEDILLALRAVSPDALAALKPDPGTQMLALTDFAAQLAEVALAPHLTAAAFADKSKALAQRYDAILPNLANEALPLIEAAVQQLDHFVHTLRIKSLPPRALQRLKHRAAAIDPAGSVAPARAPHAPSAEPPAPALFSWQAEIDRLAALAAGNRTSDALLSAAIDSVCRGLAAPECLLFSRLSGASEFALTHGRGRSYQRFHRPPLLRKDERTVFGVCLTRGENILIHRAADPKIAPYLPAWLPPSTMLGAFVLLPLAGNTQTHGLLLAGWPVAKQIALSPDETRLIRQLLATAVQPRQQAAA